MQSIQLIFAPAPLVHFGVEPRMVLGDVRHSGRMAPQLLLAGRVRPVGNVTPGIGGFLAGIRQREIRIFTIVHRRTRPS